MTRARRAVICPRDPIGLRLEEAAAFIGVGQRMFRQMVSEGVMPCPLSYKRALIWDAEELIVAFRRLPRKELDLKPGVRPPHDEVGQPEDPYDQPPRAF